MVALLACGRADSQAGSASGGPTPVRVMVVAPTASQQDLAVTGTVEALESAEVRPEAAGPVQSIGFDHGQAVKAGDVLVRLRDAEARAAVDEAEARLALANAQLERTKVLF